MGNTPAAARLPAPRDKDPGQLLAVARPHTLAAAPQLTARKLRLVQPSGRRLLEPRQPAPPLGLHPAPVVEQVRLEGEDRLLLYTDGLVEARAADRRQFELDDRAEACLTAASLNQALDGLVELLLAHSGGRLNDDLALVLAAPVGTGSGTAPPPVAVEEAAG